MQKVSTAVRASKFGYGVLMGLALGCAGAAEKPKDGLEGTVSLDNAAAQTFNANINLTVVDKKYEFESDPIPGGVRIKLAQPNPAAAAVGTFSVTGSPNVTVNLRRAVGQTWLEAVPTAGTIEVTQIPTAVDPVWIGTIRNLEATFSSGPKVLIQEADFRATFQGSSL
jgi:hypothetical protein